jgi:SAM-dependent methyltransferase
VLDLGSQPLANSLLRPQDLARVEFRVPLKVFVCSDCWLLQITDVIQPGELFADYPYLSSFSDTMLRSAKTAASRYMAEFGLGRDSLVVEIGSNDGYLLKNFVAADVPSLGIEPAANIASMAEKQGIETLVKFFSADFAMDLVTSGKKADLILGNNVLAHAPEINDFVAGLALLLKPEGYIVLEFPYACDLVERAEFDTIYHEHVFYFTLTSLVRLFDRHNLAIVAVERMPIHGGSLRLFASHPELRQVKPSGVTSLLDEEKAKGVMSPRYYEGFEIRVRDIRAGLVNRLHELKEKRHSIAAYGASAKGSTLLNYCGIGAEVIDFVADRNRAKQGRLTPGAHLPIVPAEELLVRQPDYTLLLTWNFADEILAQQAEYRRRGGKFIIPMPAVQVV